MPRRLVPTERRGAGAAFAAVFALTCACGAPADPGPEPIAPETETERPETETEAPDTPPPLDPEALLDQEPGPEDEPLAPPGPLVFPPGPFEHAALLNAIRDDRPRQFKPVGTTSVVFRMHTRGEHTAAFKPRARNHPSGYLKEVAAYRVGWMLGLDNVAPATLRRVTLGEIRDRLHPRYDDEETFQDLRQGMRSDSRGVPGAAIYWVPEMHSQRLERGEMLETWRGWLTQGQTIPEDRVPLARDLSTMVAFDYLIGNWDRFSGGNMQALIRDDDQREGPRGDRLFLRDHDVAFPAPLPDEVHERILERLRFSQKFSRAFVGRLARFDRAALQAALSAEPDHATDPLLGPEQIRGVLERRETLLSYVGALVDEHGEDAVLCFD